MTRARLLPLALVVFGVAACADYVGDDVRSGRATIPEGAEELFTAQPTVPTLPPDPVDPRSLGVDACFDDVADETGEQPDGIDTYLAGEPVVPLDCRHPHRYELFATGKLAAPGAAWPGAEAIAEQADSYCVAQFSTFVGTPWAGSTLDYAAQVPNEDRWSAGDRRVSCALFDLGLSPLEGSMAGRAR
ncbi:MAG: septum formation family protein [Acidimicrobiia bacterium]|nr:septum formation family protein [Acidimicrobiia bacterium]